MKKLMKLDSNTIIFLLLRSVYIPATMAIAAVANIEMDKKKPKKSSPNPASTMYRLKITLLIPKAKDEVALDAIKRRASLPNKRMRSKYLVSGFLVKDQHLLFRQNGLGFALPYNNS